MVPQRLRCLFRAHRWHNGWDEETHQTVWTCKRCGLIKTEIHGISDGGAAAGGSAFQYRYTAPSRQTALAAQGSHPKNFDLAMPAPVQATRKSSARASAVPRWEREELPEGGGRQEVRWLRPTVP